MKYLHQRGEFLQKVNESNLNLILESVLDYTEQFKDIIDEIWDNDDGTFSGGSEDIAWILKRLTNKDIDTPVNFIHIGDNNNTIKFINAKKGDKLIDETPGAYAPSKRRKILNNQALKSKNSMRIGRFVRKMIDIYHKKFPDSKNKAGSKTIDVNDKDIEDFVNDYKSLYDKYGNMMDNFRVISGEEIAEAYDCINYWDDYKGQLGESCMKDVDPDYFEIYTENSNVNLLILTMPGEGRFGEGIMGRALLWNLSDGESVFMDRIYTSRDSDMQLFKMYAKEHGFIYKESQDYSSGSFLIPNNNYSESVDMEMIVLMESDRDQNIDLFPYCDTMKYFYWKEGEISNTNGRGDGYIVLDSVDGGWSCDFCDGYGIEDCENCGGWGHSDCQECLGDGIKKCESCNGFGEETCDQCHGNGVEDCPECDGIGEIDGEDCKHCGGDAKITCQGCGGSGEEICNKCGGYGGERCQRCENGRIDCENCDGEGELECERCGGRKN